MTRPSHRPRRFLLPVACLFSLVVSCNNADQTTSTNTETKKDSVQTVTTPAVAPASAPATAPAQVALADTPARTKRPSALTRPVKPGDAH